MMFVSFNRRTPLVEQELFTIPQHLSSSRVFSGIHVAQSLVCYVLLISICPFALSVLIRSTASDYPFVLSVLIRSTASDYSFGAFKRLLLCYIMMIVYNLTHIYNLL
jgi:hypothetical protein